MTDLGTLGGPYSYAYGVNDSVQAVGYSHTSDGHDHAFLYSNGGGMTDLGTLGGPYSYAYGVNDSGQAVGWSEVPSGDGHAFVYNNGRMTDLGTFPDGADSMAYAINASGQVVGSAATPTSVGHAFLYTNGVMTDLGTLPGFTYFCAARGINASGQVVGTSQASAGGQVHAFLYSNGGMTDLGTLGGPDSFAYGINDSRQVVGLTSTSAGQGHAFLYSNGVMTDLNSLLPPGSGWELDEAFAINDTGEVVGDGIHNGASHAFLLNLNANPAFQWTGQGSDALWSDGANWLGGHAPTPGADLLFPAGAAQQTTVDDLGSTFHSLTASDNYQISGHPLTLTGDLLVHQGTLELDNSATIGGTTTITAATTLSLGGGSLTVASGLTVNGTLKVGGSTSSDSGTVNFTATQTVAGSGDILLGQSAGNALSITSPSTQVTFAPGLTVHGSSGSLLVLDASDSYVNNGLIADDVASGHLYLHGTWTNNGTFRARNAGFLEVDSSPTNYTPNATLTGGTWQVYDNSTLFVQFAGPIDTNAATILLDGPLANFQGVGFTDALFYLLTNAGSLTLRDGRQLTLARTGPGLTNTATGTLLIGDTLSQFTVLTSASQGRALTNLGTFINTGQVSLGGDFLNARSVQLISTSTVSFTTSTSGYTQVAGSTTLNGGTLHVPLPVNLQGGTLSGVGTINGGLTNAAQVFVGSANSTGILTVTGNYSQTAAGTLHIKLKGTAAGSGYDQLSVGGTATLAAGATLNTTRGFVSAIGDTFTILPAAGGISGTFNGLPDGATLAITGELFRINYPASGVVLTHFANASGYINFIEPATVTAGVPFPITVQVLDSSDHLETGYTGTVHLTASNGVMANYTFTPADMGQHTFTITLTHAGTLGVTGSDSVAGISGSTSFTVAAAAPDHLAFNEPASVTAGAPFQITVTVQDRYNNTETGYTGTVHFMASNGAMANYTFTPADMGTHTFTITLRQAGTLGVTGTDTANPALTGNTSFTIVPAADHLVFLQPPSTTAAGHTINPAVVVAVVDQFGNVETGDNSDVVTLSLSTNPGAGTLSGTLTMPVSGGTATFSDLSINAPGVGYTLHATIGGSLPDIDSNPFNIT
jgi:probable HAF family extracellular repeat protein